MGIEFRTELRSTILPPKLMYLCPQLFNLPLSVSTIGSQVAILLEFAPTGRPKYLNGTLPLLQFKKLHAISMNSKSTFTPIKELL